MSTFSSQHHNAIAKDIREELDQHKPNRSESGYRRDLYAWTGLTLLAIRLAKRFKADNKRFDPRKFLDQCSPNVDLYPLSKLWEDDGDIDE